jgi:hypothetical protein
MSAIFLSFCLAGKVFILNNTDFLFTIAEGLGQPSKAYYIVIERIYELAAKNKLEDQIGKHLHDSKNENLNSLYISTLGVIGNPNWTGAILNSYVKYQNDPSNIVMVSKVIDCIGILGSENVVPILENLIENYDRLQVKATKYSIVRALYLSTGKRYEYINNSGVRTKIKLTGELEKARQVVLESKNRKRTFKEMVLLDKVFRPPGW